MYQQERSKRSLNNPLKRNQFQASILRTANTNLNSAINKIKVMLNSQLRRYNDYDLTIQKYMICAL